MRLAGRNVVVLGLGATGMSLVRWLSRRGALVRVADTGVGIAPTDLPRITERFYLADRARSRELGGTGLGLAIVKHLVHAHGGELRVESAPGRGTMVSFTLPGGADGAMA